jgi:histidinol-phosphatase (PHP family)
MGKLLTDYHTHSWRCGHAAGTLSEYVRAAAERGIDEIGLTDHLPIYFQPPGTKFRKWAIPAADYIDHYEEMIEVRRENRPLIPVKISVEADFAPGFERELDRWLQRYDFDYVLGSVHFLGDWMIDDVDQSHMYASRSIAEVYERYYRDLRMLVATAKFDVVAHFDLPKKFGYRPERDVSAAVLETLDAVRDHDMAIEVSTAGLRKPVREIYPSRTIMEWMREREIPIVLSSDAHHPSEIGFAFDEAIRVLREVGYTKLATYRDRMRTIRDLG